MPKKYGLKGLIVAAALSLLGSSTLAFAQAPADAPPAPRFDISRFEVTGNTLLTPSEVDRAVTPFVGKQKDFGDIQRALQALELAYRQKGYGVVQVLVPEQDITSGTVILRAIQPRIGKVVIEGNEHYSEGNIRASLPELQPGRIPNSDSIARNLQLLDEHPTKQTQVGLKAGAEDDTIDATVTVRDEKPLRFVATLDNTGTRDTGRLRAGIGMQHSNLFDRDHILNFQYVTNPENPGKVTILGAGYRIPFYAAHSSLDLFAGYSDVDSGTLQGLFNVSGSGTIFGARYNIYLPKLAEQQQYQHKLSLGLDYRAFKNNVTILGVALVPDITIHPASITYTGLWRAPASEVNFYASYSHNIPGGDNGRDVDFGGPKPGFPNGARTGADASYQILRGGVVFNQALPQAWQLRALINAQYTSDALVPGEQFGFGGPDSVRGFNVREVADDKGYTASVELYTPELGSKFGWKTVRARALTFYDRGSTSRNNSQPGDPGRQTGASVGLGLRLSAGKQLNLRVEFARVLDAAGMQGKGDQMVHAAVAVAF